MMPAISSFWPFLCLDDHKEKAKDRVWRLDIECQQQVVELAGLCSDCGKLMVKEQHCSSEQIKGIELKVLI